MGTIHTRKHYPVEHYPVEHGPGRYVQAEHFPVESAFSKHARSPANSCNHSHWQ